ncbi:hypothetical protein [Nocardia sp. NPDC051832]|uniref:hypothetical protein n=1 Tax=Nocardia sp. NPDC051832 TaxID=3155673 RepID=UPI00341275FD
MAPVVVYDLDADLAKLGTYQTAWKSQQEKLSWAAETINQAAGKVVGSGWQGPASVRYDSHRGKLVADLDECADLAGKVATAVGACIHTLRFNQGQLDNEKAKLNGKVPFTETGLRGAVEFNPADDEQQELVGKLVTAYTEIRGRVDKQLANDTETFQSATAKFKDYESKWTRRTLRTLNWNVQQGGKGNKPWGQGHQMHDMGELAQRLIDGKVDVATLQELFGDGAAMLQTALDRLDPEGNWEVHFGKASMKNQTVDLWWPNPFGNAVAVRTGSGLSTGDVTVTDLGDGDEGRSVTRVPITVDR